MSTPPKLQWEYGTLYLFFTSLTRTICHFLHILDLLELRMMERDSENCNYVMQSFSQVVNTNM